MCGIYITNITYKENEVRSKLEKIRYRGPDHTGVLQKGGLSLGHLRLAILDLDERSNQPFQYKKLSIVFNGEIYNFKDIRAELERLGYSFDTTSDTEVLLKGYDAWGRKILDRLNGMFAFAIYDIENERVFCARDRLGVKPFYYYWRDGKFEICSQLQPLINNTSKISKEAVSIYLDCGYIPSPYSILDDVYKLPPGNFMVIDINAATKEITEYWNLEPVKEREISYEEAKKELHELLIDAVKIRMHSDVPLGSFLSGGIDSALVSAIASKFSNTPLNTFTIGFNDPKFDESEVAAQFASVIRSNHTTIVCGPEEVLQMLPKLIEVFDEPFADSSALPSLLLNSVTKKHATVALSGDGGDESFLGYQHFDQLLKFQRLSKIPFPIRKLSSRIPLYKIFGGRPGTLKGILKTEDADSFAWNIFTGFDTIQKCRETDWRKYYEKYRSRAKEDIQKMADLNIKLWLENDSNVKVDRASMAFSMEIRSPFQDYRVVEFARSLSIDYRFKPGLKKIITRDILSEYIPEKVFDLPKRGFSIPLGKWIREDLKKDIELFLSDEFLYKVYNLDVDKFKIQLAQHMGGKFDYSANIWKVYMLAKWYDNFKL